MNQNDLYESIGQADEDLLERSEQNKRKRAPRRPWWMAAAAALLVAVIAAGVYFWPNGSPLVISVQCHADHTAEFGGQGIAYH